MTSRLPRSVAALVAGCAAVALAGCLHAPGPPTAGAARGFVPDLRGTPVMVLPVQSRPGVPGDPEAELVFALTQRGPGVRWLMPATLRAELARSPMLDVPLEQLPVDVFLRVQVNRIGDPLFGYLKRLSAISGGRLALIPVEVRHRAATKDRPGAIEVVATLIDVDGGRVTWFGVVQGTAGEASNPAALASAADALARVLLPAGA